MLRGFYHILRLVLFPSKSFMSDTYTSCGGEKEANFYSTFSSLLKSEKNEKSYEVTIFPVFLLGHRTYKMEYTSLVKKRSYVK